MQPSLLLPALILVFSSLTQSIDQHATATVRLNKSFFQLASGKAKGLIDDLVPRIRIPAINVTSGSGIYFWTRWINLTHFDFPRTSFSISKEGLTWNTAGGKIEIQMQFVVRWETGKGPIFTKHGIATISVEDLRTTLNALIKIVNARPQLVTNKCSASVDKLDVVFDADITGILLNFLRSYVLGYIKDFLNREACPLVTILAERANKFARKQPEEIHIWKNIYLNYTAAKDPIYHDNFIEAECSFRVAINENKTAAVEFDEEHFIHDVLDSLESDHVAFTPSFAAAPAYFVGTVLNLIRDFLLYALAAYGLFCIVQAIVTRILRWRRRSPQFPSHQCIVYENLAVDR